jgi:hypothetical protein
VARRTSNRLRDGQPLHSHLAEPYINVLTTTEEARGAAGLRLADCHRGYRKESPDDEDDEAEWNAWLTSFREPGKPNELGGKEHEHPRIHSGIIIVSIDWSLLRKNGRHVASSVIDKSGPNWLARIARRCSQIHEQD